MSLLTELVLPAVILLLTPGPTNTLLATAGAGRGFRAALHLVVAELLGYALAIALLLLVIGPAVAASPAIGWALRLTCALFLIYLAVQLWRRPATDPVNGAHAVGFRRVLIATLLNPKSLVFVFLLLPTGATLPQAKAILAVAILIPLAGSCWIALGAALRAGAAPRLGIVTIHRIGALVLAIFALVLPLTGLLR